MMRRFGGRLRRFLCSESTFPLLIYFFVSLWFIQDHYCRSDFPLDDAWIHRVYARSFAMGHGFAYNPGRQETGCTSPLWILVSAPAHWLECFGTPWVVGGVKLIGWMLGAAVVIGVGRVAQLLTDSRLVAGIAASLMAVEPRLIFSAFSGMETTLLVALWIWACVALLRRYNFWFLLLLGLMPMARPEAVLLLPLALLALPGELRSARPVALKLATLLGPILPQLLWSSTCLLINGRPLPNTFYLKASPFQLGWTQLDTAWRGLVEHGLPSLLAWPVGMLVFLAFCLLRRNRTAWQCVALIPLSAVAYLLGVVSTRAVLLQGYYWTRWLDPGTIVLSVPFCIGLSLLFAPGAAEWRNPRASAGSPRAAAPDVRRRPSGALRLALAMLALTLSLFSLPQFRRTMLDRRSHLATDSRAIAILDVGMGKWLHDNTAADAVLATDDAGAIRYFGDRTTIDLCGLNTSEIANQKLAPQDALSRCDWVCVFPGLLPPEALKDIQYSFSQRHIIRVPLEEYTVCPSPIQTVRLAARRVVPAPN